jgi:uncharacterized protein (DUF1330 family)
MSRPDVLNEDFVKSLPDTGPVVMINLVRFRERSTDGNGSGWDAYLRYSQMTMPLIKARGGTALWAGNVQGAAFGDAGKRWDYAVLVMYPSRAAFLDMVTSADYAKANVHREAGAEEHLILATDQTYSKLVKG